MLASHILPMSEHAHGMSERNTGAQGPLPTSRRPRETASRCTRALHGRLCWQMPPPVQQPWAESYSTWGPGLHYVLETQNDRRHSPALQELAEDKG